jgi:hypothetical protein
MRILPSVLILALVLLGQLQGQSAACIQFGKFRSVGKVPAALVPAGTLHEVSGLEASRINPGVLWAHDDGGKINQLVAITTTGTLVQQYQVGSIVNGDWEDLAIGPGPEKGRDYIYLADIGNNNLKSTAFSLVRFPEPITPPKPGRLIVIKNIEIFAFKYPSQTHDAETLLIDPVDGRPYVLTKEAKPSTTAYLYGYPMPLDGKNIKTMKLERKFTHAAPRFSGGDVSSDGRWIIVRNKGIVYTYLRGVPTSGFAASFANLVCLFNGSKQGNAEAITISPDGTHLYCASEAIGSPIYESVGKLPVGTKAMPAWWNFGSESKSWLWGSPGLSLDTFPALGRKISLTLWSARPGAKAAFGFDTKAIPDGVVRFAGGWAHVLPSLVVLTTTTRGGTAELPLGVPTSVTLLGVKLHAQAAIEDIAASFGLALTRGLTLQVGR